jgi:hypothetical protein
MNVILDLRFNLLALPRAGESNGLVGHATGERSISNRGLGKVSPKGLKITGLIPTSGYRASSRQDIAANPGSGVMATQMLKLVVSILNAKLLQAKPNLLNNLVQ